jgi:glycosyltransferase involved in cell wall biosynthesis
MPVLTRGPNRGARLFLNYLAFVLSGLALLPLLARGRYDVTFVYAPSPITQCIPAIWLRWLRGIPVAFWVQDLWPDTLVATGAVRSPVVLRMVGALSRWIYRHCDLVLATSHGFLRPIRVVCPEVSHLQVLPNWADAFYRPDPVERDAPERRELPTGFTIMFAGNLGSAQSLGTVLDAAEILRGQDVHWVFVGDGNQRASLEAGVEERRLGSHIRFLGWKPGEAMPRYLNCADALLVSLRRDESFALTIPAKLQSSLAVGRPVLAALEGEGARVVHESGAGVVVEQESGEALAAGALSLLRAGAAGREEMGRRGRDYAMKHFDRDTLVARLDEWLHAVVEERREDTDSRR